MPYLIQHIDAIAREKQRGVLMLQFHNNENFLDCLGFEWESLAIRPQIISWLDSKKIGWCPCAGMAQIDLMSPYMGEIYIDLPYDHSIPAYQELENYLENPDGSMRYENVLFFYLPLEEALKRKEHDEPGFWEKWAEDF